MNKKRPESDASEIAEEAILALSKFEKKFSTEEVCMELLLSRLLKSVKCKACRGNNLRRIARSRDYYCNSCGDISSLTAGTAFAGVRKAGPHLKLIWLLERGFKFNCFQIHRHLGIAYSTCLSILKKLSKVIQDKMDPLAKKVHSAQFLTLFKKRSRLTPANEHPQAEQRIANLKVHEVKKAQFNSENPDPNLQKIESLSEFERKIYDLISKEKIHFDYIAYELNSSFDELAWPLYVLEDKGFIQRLPADYYIVKEIDYSKNSENEGSERYSKMMKKRIADCKTFIREKFDGISRKYLQNYLAIFWCMHDQKTWGRNKLFEACSQSGEISQHQILMYETPIEVSFVSADGK
jgi:hypothetical protein